MALLLSGSRTDAAMAVLHSGALGLVEKDGHVDPRWFVLHKDNLVYYPSFMQASLKPPPDGLIALSSIVGMDIDVEDPSTPRLVVRFEQAAVAGSQGEVVLVKLEQGDDLHRWMEELRRASEAEVKADTVDDQRSQASRNSKGSVSSLRRVASRISGKLSICLDVPLQAVSLKKANSRGFNATISDADYKTKLKDEKENLDRYTVALAQSPPATSAGKGAGKSPPPTSARKGAATVDQSALTQELQRQNEDLRREQKEAREANQHLQEVVKDFGSSGAHIVLTNSTVSKLALALAKDRMVKHEDDLRTQLDAERQHVFQLTQDLQDMQRQHAQSSADQAAKVKQTERMQMLLKKELETSGKLRKEGEEMRGKLFELRRGAPSSATEREPLEPQDPDTLQSLENVKSRNAQLLSQVAVLGEQLQQRGEECASLRDQVTLQRDQISKMTSRQQADRVLSLLSKRTAKDHDDVLHKCQGLEDKVKVLTGQVEEKDAELKRWKGAALSNSREGHAAEEILKTEMVVLDKQKEDFRMQVVNLTAQGRDKDRMATKLREQIQELRSQLQTAREELKTSQAGHKQLKDEVTAARAGGHLYLASTATSRQRVAGVEGDEVAAESEHLDWELPNDFRANLTSALRLPQKALQHLLERPVYHGVVCVVGDGTGDARYGMLYQDRLELFSHPLDLTRGNPPAISHDMDDFVGVEFDKAGLGLNLRFRDHPDFFLKVRSKTELLAWHKAVLGSRQKLPQASSGDPASADNKATAKPTKGRPKDRQGMGLLDREVPATRRRDKGAVGRKSVFSSRGHGKGKWKPINTNRDGAEAEARILRGPISEATLVHASNRAAKDFVHPDVSDKLTSTDRSPSLPKKMSADKITGDRTMELEKEKGLVNWQKITYGVDGKPEGTSVRRTSHNVTSKVGGHEAPRVAARGRKQVSEKITGAGIARTIRSPSPEPSPKIGTTQ